MKDLILYVSTTLFLVVSLNFINSEVIEKLFISSHSINFERVENDGICSSFDFDDHLLDQVVCTCATGELGEKMDCVPVQNKCCLATGQTSCECW